LPVATVTFVIAGMHCAACAFRNERALRKIPGVRTTTVDLGTRRAHIEFDHGRVSEAALRQAIIDNGYEVLPDRAPADPRKHEFGGSRSRQVLEIMLTFLLDYNAIRLAVLLMVIGIVVALVLII
jgi:cation transport ATPase